MTLIDTRRVLAWSACALLAGPAFSQELDEVVVQATRLVATKTVGHTASGIPIVDVSLSYGVSAADLQLATHAGAMELEKRVTDAALAACKELGRQYPDSVPKDAECAKAASEKAMVKAHELEAAAASKRMR